MKHVLLMAFVLVLGASMAFSQTPGHLGLYSDANLSNCGVLEVYPGIYQVFVIHTLGTYVSALAFSVPVPGCASVSWLSDSSDFPSKIGFSPSGVEVFYGSCREHAAFVVLRILYAGSPSQNCCPLMIQGSTMPTDPPYPAALMCPWWVEDPYLEVLTVSPAYFNANATCGCTVPSRETTWGQVKALYVE